MNGNENNSNTQDGAKTMTKTRAIKNMNTLGTVETYDDGCPYVDFDNCRLEVEFQGRKVYDWRIRHDSTGFCDRFLTWDRVIANLAKCGATN